MKSYNFLIQSKSCFRHYLINTSRLYSILLLLTIIVFSSCDEYENGDDDVLIVDTSYLGLWRADILRYENCDDQTIEGESLIFSPELCTSTTSGYCYYTTLCLLDNARYILTEHQVDEFDQTFITEGVYSVIDGEINFCPDNSPCEDPVNFYIVRNTASETNELTIVYNNNDNALGGCDFRTSYVQLESLAHEAIVYISCDSDFQDMNGNVELVNEIGQIDLNTAVVGNGLSIAQYDSYLEYTPATLVDDGTFSFAVWVRDDQDNGSHEFMTCNNFRLSSAADGALGFSMQFKSGSTVNWLGPNVSNIDGTNWNHMVGTFDGTSANLYLNGTLVDSETFNNEYLIQDSGFFIGNSYQQQNPSDWTGGIDEFMIFDRVLTAAEATELYEL